MLIRKSTELDFDRIMEIYKYDRKYMAEQGNPNQWGPTNWPPAALIHNDIKDGNSYVCVNDEGTVIGTFFFIQGEEIEPTYRRISDGSWMETVRMVLFTDWQEMVQRKELAHFVSTGRFDSADIYELIHMAITR